MLIRIRSRDGLERLQIDNPNITIAQLKTLIESQLRVPLHNQTLSTNQSLLIAKTPSEISRFTDMSNPQTLISTLGIAHGSMIYLAYEGERTVAGPQVRPAGSFGRKMTMDDLIAKQMRITRQENPHCELVSFDRDAANGFQHYVNETLAFAVKRGGFMYGTVSEEGKVEVDFIYEPPQQGTEESLILLRDPDEERLVEAIALGLGMRRVGFIFTQTIGQTKKDYTLSNREILQAVELQGESDLKEWVTVMVKLEVNEDGAADVHFEAFQMSLTTTVIGVGIMALPATMKVWGLVCGVILILLMGILSEISVELLVRFTVQCRALSYGEVVEQALGTPAKILSDICIILNNAGVLVVYLIILGDVMSGSPKHAGVFDQWLGNGV